MIDLSKSGGIWILRLDRPEKANSLTLEMLERIAEVAQEGAAARALIITGTGKVFSAGADLEAAKSGLATSDVWEKVSGAIADLPCLTIAALNGTLAGGAFGMALACDIRIAVPHAKFFYPVMKLGYLPQPSDPTRMTNIIGPARAKMVLMAGQKLSAEDALVYGLIERICQPEELMQQAIEFTNDVCTATPEHVSAIKKMCD
ncbi:MAG: enoyl-CoA hydratase/isomerase family protein [Paracoccaceae bacterium]|nr:enoyl-CoA hydratase/isomerase family protein [Paracoccaceae bacterium]